ncbi:MAG: MGMT family protein [Actinobacteria bacterium]|nr:MGMT family protein [Actinomycetota bacterium]
MGTLNLISNDQILIASGFTDFSSLHSQLDSDEQEMDFKKATKVPAITDLINDYFDGDLQAIDGITVRQPGENFSQSAWKAMRKIAPGKTLSYADLAKRAGSADAVRAAGSACARNLVAVVVPCHRVVRTGGALGNYAYGLKAKEWLLRHEGALK